MNSQANIIFSYAFDQSGSAQKISNRKTAQELENEGLAWVHLDANHPATKSWFEKKVSYLDHLIIDALIANEARPRIIEFEKGILIILCAVNLNSNAAPDDVLSLRIWIDDCRIITLQRSDIKAVSDIAKNIDNGKLIRNSGEFLYNLLYEVLSDTSSFLYGLNQTIDDLEAKVTRTHDIKFREQIIKIRSDSAIFKRYLIPQKEVIKKLQTADQSWLNDWARRHFQENYDNVTRMIEEAEEARERSQILHDELSNALSEKLNKSIYKLSVITSIFMPLTFITGLLGMNIGGVPGINNPRAFDVCLFVMLLVFMLQIMFFKRSKFF
ncbi:MAG: CorA family divalent cation transporter [Rickettsiales bacterium]|nr:CorA family divalent cation transporter [Rickettsiales bacterium]